MPIPATLDFDHAADRWVARYLPQWSTPERSAARYELDAGILTLRIDADQPPWLPEGDQRLSRAWG